METYEVLKPISIDSIMKAEPCNSDGEFWKFVNEVKEKGLPYNHEITTWNGFQKFKVLMEYKDWFLNKYFIKENDQELNVGDSVFYWDDEYKICRIDSIKNMLISPRKWNRFDSRTFTTPITLRDLNSLFGCDNKFTIKR